MISKNKILSVMNEPEETGSMEPLHTATHEITFDNVDFEYVPGEPVLKHATFTVPDQKLTAIVGDSGSGMLPCKTYKYPHSSLQWKQAKQP